MKRIASIQDISCLGRCSLTVALPVISAMAVECAIVPTAVLSAHTAFPGFVSRDLSDQLTAIAAHWRSQHVHFDALYTGYIASAEQVRQVLDFFDAVRSPDTMIFVDPAMADHGKLYTGFGPDFPSVMAQVVAQADVAIPNLTEACLLTGTPYREEMDEPFVRELLRGVAALGAKRVVLAREMTLQDIAILRDKTPPELEIEAFVHGAMCMSVSGRCLLSNYMAGRDANRGQCAQPCRWKYYLSEETRPGQLYEIGENENGSYILNANDMCTAPFLDLICKAGVDSLKIEGRAKTFYYVASVTAAYRRALDAYLADPLNDNFELPAEVYEELTRTSHRHYSPGFYFGREQARQATDSATYIREWEFVGTVDGWENGVASCQQRGKWSLGDTLEALCPDGRSIPLNPEWIENEAGERVESTPHAMEKYTIPTPELPPMSLLRRKTV